MDSSLENLDDVQLAILLSLVANEHCILTASREDIEKLQDEVETFVKNVFRYSVVVVDFSENLSMEQLASRILIEERLRTASPNSRHEDGYFSRKSDGLCIERLPNVILLKHFNLASVALQAQMLDLMTSRKLSHRGRNFTAPERFLMVPLLIKTMVRPSLMFSLLDRFFISHDYEEIEVPDEASVDSLSSVIVRKPSTPTVASPGGASSTSSTVLVTEDDLIELSRRAKLVFFHVEVKRFMADIVTFLRLHRAVAGGVTSAATKHFELLVRCLAPLHDWDYVTPTLAQLAVSKVYSHRIEIVKPEDELSLCWGSAIEAVRSLLEGVTAEAVIEDVLDSVRMPA